MWTCRWTTDYRGTHCDGPGDGPFRPGSFLWTAGPETDPLVSEALVRVTADDGTQPSDESDAPFLIANAGSDYYVNDDSTSGDLFTTIAGNNAYSGKSPTAPMANLAALLAAYDLDPGDAIHVDTGTYALVRNVILDSQDSGVLIEGPAADVALLDRGNTATGSHVIIMSGADDVTLDHLQITGGYYGVYASSTADSDRLSITDSTIFGNYNTGIYLQTTNDTAVLSGNELYGQPYGLYLEYGADVVVSGNRVHDHTYTGIYLTADAAGRGERQ